MQFQGAIGGSEWQSFLMLQPRGTGQLRRSRRQRAVAGITLVTFPSARNIHLIEALARELLAIPPGPDRTQTFRKTSIASVAYKRRALGLPREVVRADMHNLAAAVERFVQEQRP